MEHVQIGIIGGSGLYDMAGVTDRSDVALTTPFGEPSGPYVTGTLQGRRVAFLARHAVGHRVSPSEINYRANIFGMKLLGVEYILSASAVGSLKEEYKPLDIVIPDQFFDRTNGRASTFFDEPGVVAHVGFADPVCPSLRTALTEAVREGVPDAVLHSQGTIVVIEGPRFSTRAESEQYRQMGADVIGMNAMPEAALCREAELPYALLALSTDYDCWHRGEEAVSADMVAATMRKNVGKATKAILALAVRLPDPTTSPAYRCLDSAVMTSPELLTPECARKLTWLRPFSALTVQGGDQ